MWLVMRGAIAAKVQKVHQDYYLPSMTGIAVAIYENLAAAPWRVKRAATCPHGHAARRRGELRRNLSLHLGAQRKATASTVPASADHPSASPCIPGRRSRLQKSAGLTDEECSWSASQMARDDPIRRQFLHARKARCGRGHLQSSHLRRHAG